VADRYGVLLLTDPWWKEKGDGMSLDTVYLKVRVEVKDKYHCSPECPYNDCNQYCQLFGEALRDYAFRDEKCVEMEVKS
jgi:hypothetical protein